MKTTLFYKQMGRSPKTVLVNLVILLVTTAFFVMSVNLYSSSSANLRRAEETYSTIAIMELYGDVNRRGELTARDSEDYAGYQSVGVKGFDLEPIVTASGVIGYDLRSQYGAYVEGEASRTHELINGDPEQLLEPVDIIRFTLEEDEPLTFPLHWNMEEYDTYFDRGGSTWIQKDFHIIDSASEVYSHAEPVHFMMIDGLNTGSSNIHEEREYYADQVRRLNRSDEIDYITLYPGVEYVATTWYSHGFRTKEGLLSGGHRFYPGAIEYFGEDFHVSYFRNNETKNSISGKDADHPFPIARWEDVQNDPKLKEQWEGAWEAAKYNACSYTVCLTDDITGVPMAHLGGAYLVSGRMITAEEYESGAKVFMISKEMANTHHWHVGDKKKIDFFQFSGIPNRQDTTFWEACDPVYHKNTEGFFDSGEYELVGIYDQRKIAGNSGIARSTMSMIWNAIYLPKNSVQNTLPEEELPVHGALLTIWLENGSVDAFLSDMDALGITEKKEGQYNASFTFYDQGYSIIQPSLQAMHSTAKLLLILSSLLLVITCVLMAWFYAQNQRHNIGIFRMLGGKKPQAVAAVLVCALIITLLGAVPGAYIGYSLSERVGESLLSGGVEETDRHAALRAYVLTAKDDAPKKGNQKTETDGEEEAEEESQLAVRADKQLSALAACGALLFPAVIGGFVLSYIGKEPRELLPKSRA